FTTPFNLSIIPPSHPDPLTLSLHDALPICRPRAQNAAGVAENDLVEHIAEFNGHFNLANRTRAVVGDRAEQKGHFLVQEVGGAGDRKSTRLNSSHGSISYAVFCLKKKKIIR